MHSNKNISERNKIDSQSRADAYIRRKRLISMMHLKVFLKLKNPKNSLFWANICKKTNKTPKKPKNPKNPRKKKKKKTTGLVFFKNPGFFQPCGQQETPRPGYQLVEFTPNGHTANINNSTSSANFLTYRRAADLAPCNELVITELALIVTSRGEEPPHSFVRVDRNLNRSLVGSDVYLCFKGQCREIIENFYDLYGIGWRNERWLK
jgi:hypothetical protein